MRKKEIIKQIIRNFQEEPLPEVFPRSTTLPLHARKVISLTGVRRSGKTFLLFDTIRRLMSEGIPKTDILYLNFEDERLELTTDELDLILQAWRELHNGKMNANHYIFFDEIQNIPSWEKFIRRLYDSVTKNIFITGSNSHFLSTDIATALRGRTLTYELFPFSFAEYVRYKGIETDFYVDVHKSRLITAFGAYLKKGGFPEILDRTWEESIEVLRTYFFAMLYKDIIERYQVTEPQILKYFIKRLASNLTKTFSIHKIYQELRSQGYKLDKNLLYNYLDYIQNVYLAFTISKFDYSLIKRSGSFKKVYFVDNGLINTIVPPFSEEAGKLFENAVYLFLRTHFGNIYEENIFYYKNGFECDFVVTEYGRIKYVIQAAYDISDPQTREREIRGLIKTMSALDVKTGYILTMDTEDEIKRDQKQIIIRPAYRFFLEQEQGK